MPVTIKDVARESGVNISTVSRSLNGAYGVHPLTRERVLDVARRLNYRPNRIARNLATGRSNAIGLIVGDIRNPFFAEVARGAEDAASAAGYDLILCNSDLDTDKQMHYVRTLLERRVDGVLVNSVTALNAAQQDFLANCGAPVVFLNRTAVGRSLPTVCADNHEGGVIAARHLLHLGHRSLAHLTSPRRHSNLAERARGFLRTLEAASAARPPVVIHGDQSFAGGYEMARGMFAAHKGVTAVFAANDAIACGVMRAARERGVRIPEDLSLIGFDNVELAALVNPPLTTIHQPKYEIGQAAVELLLHSVRQNGNATIEHRVLGVKLIERQTCAARRK